MNKKSNDNIIAFWHAVRIWAAMVRWGATVAVFWSLLKLKIANPETWCPTWGDIGMYFVCFVVVVIGCAVGDAACEQIKKYE